MKSSAQNIQRDYYARSAQQYEQLHVKPDDEHFFALSWMLSCIDFLGVESVLDVGSGTGRAVAFLRAQRPQLRVLGIEPSAELRAVGVSHGLPPDSLLEGDATHLPYSDASFDLVSEFGVLHHVPRPRVAVSEMLRVARRGIFISDDNHLGSGSRMGRRVKQVLTDLGLWRAAYWLRTGGKGYRISEGDGLSYPYSAFDDLAYIESRCSAVHCLNTRGHGPDLRAGASHVALLGIKKPD